MNGYPMKGGNAVNSVEKLAEISAFGVGMT
jgi:hypothetical protein